MTALIKSTDGSGWVEARVKDKVCFHPSDPLIIAKIDGHVIHFEYGERTHVPELLQLIERPFQPDDIVQSKAGSADFVVIGIRPESASIKATARIMHRGTVYYWPLDMLRHSSPLLRPVVKT